MPPGRPLALLLLPLLPLPTAAYAAGLRGRATVTDGDTIEVAGQTVRRFGIDAPEGEQTRRLGGHAYARGAAATAALRQPMSGREVTCREKDRDRYGRIDATCSVGGVDVNAAMGPAGLGARVHRLCDRPRARRGRRPPGAGGAVAW